MIYLFSSIYYKDGSFHLFFFFQHLSITYTVVRLILFTYKPKSFVKMLELLIFLPNIPVRVFSIIIIAGLGILIKLLAPPNTF